MKAELASVLSALLMSEAIATKPWSKRATPDVKEFAATGEYDSSLWIILLVLFIIMFLVVTITMMCHVQKPPKKEDMEEAMENAMGEEAMMDMMMSAP
tara:strand:- start:171 stop:464 length:294 start_codon:yes stop_codon:yes gene_type:complete